MKYYFLVSSLPSLSLQNPPPLSLDRYLDLCREHLCPTDMDALLAITGEEAVESSDAFVVAWRQRETMLRNAITKIRASRKKKDPAVHMREQTGYDSYVEKAATDAFSRSNPLERELALDKFRWQTLDELEGLDFASSRTVLAYALRLRLMARWARADIETGDKRVDEMIARAPADRQSPPAGTEAATP